MRIIGCSAHGHRDWGVMQKDIELMINKSLQMKLEVRCVAVRMDDRSRWYVYICTHMVLCGRLGSDRRLLVDDSVRATGRLRRRAYTARVLERETPRSLREEREPDVHQADERMKPVGVQRKKKVCVIMNSLKSKLIGISYYEYTRIIILCSTVYMYECNSNTVQHKVQYI